MKPPRITLDPYGSSLQSNYAIARGCLRSSSLEQTHKSQGAGVRCTLRWDVAPPEASAVLRLVLRLFTADCSNDVDVVFYKGAREFNRLFQHSLQTLQDLVDEVSMMSLWGSIHG